MKIPSSCPQWWFSSFSLQPTISVTGQTGRLVSLCNQSFLGESFVTKELGQHRSVPGYFTSISSSCEATVTEGCVSRHPVGRLCNLKKLPVKLLVGKPLSSLTGGLNKTGSGNPNSHTRGQATGGGSRIKKG